MGCSGSSDDDEEVDADLAHTLTDEAENPGCCCRICSCLCGICDCIGTMSGLKCCCCDMNHKKPMLSIERKRVCTDVPCCVLFFIALILQFYCFILALEADSDVRRLVYFSDWEGNICAPGITFSYGGVNYSYGDVNSTSGKYAAWPDIRMYAVVICVDDCSDTKTDARMVTPPFNSNVTTVATEAITGVIAGYTTENIFNAYCIPDVSDLIDGITDPSMSIVYDAFISKLSDLVDAFSLAINDMRTCFNLFIVCTMTAFFVSMLWGFLIRKIGAIIIWGSIFITIFAALMLSFSMIYYSDVAYAFGYESAGDFLLYGGYIVGIIVICFGLAVCGMWNRIRLAIVLAKETTRALQDLWTLFFYPFVPFVFLCAYFVYWILLAAVMASVVDESSVEFPTGYKIPYYTTGPTLYEALGEPDTYITTKINEDFKYALFYHFFMMLWMLNFVSYHTYMVIAGVYAEWYFAEWDSVREKSKKRGPKETQVTRCPVLASFFRTTVFHTGSLAFGSLLIAIIEFIDYTLVYFEKQFLAGEPSPVKKIIICAIKCLLKCMKCIMDRINRNGYIITAVYGWPFCAASIKGIAIIFKNFIRAAALGMVSGYLQMLGRICILSVNTGLITFIAIFWYDEELLSPINPALVAFTITWFVCWQYMHLYEVGLSTIFICFLIDEERNERLGTMRASRKLQRIIGAVSRKAERMETRKKRVSSDEDSKTESDTHTDDDLGDDGGSSHEQPTGNGEDVEMI